MRRSLLLVSLALALVGVFAVPSLVKAAGTDNNSFPNDPTAFDFLIDHGLTAVQAAGVIGNLDQESGDNPGSVQLGGPGRGIAQWSVGGRWDSDTSDNLVAFAQGNEEPTDSLTTQLNFLWYELETFPQYGLAQLRQSATVASSTVAFETHFEACGQCDESTRIQYADRALQAYGAYEELAAPTDQIAVTDQLNGAPELFFQGPDNSLSSLWQDGTNWNLAAPITPPGVVFSFPAITQQSNGLPEIFFEGPGHALDEVWLENDRWLLASAIAPPGTVFSDPAVVQQPDGLPSVYFEGPDNSLDADWLGSGSWHLAASISGPNTVFSDPVVMNSLTSPTVYFEGADNALDALWLGTSWNLAPIAPPGSDFSAPSALNQANGLPALYFEGPANSLSADWLGTSWNLVPSISPNGTAFSTPVIINAGDGLPELFFGGPSGSLSAVWLDAAGWHSDSGIAPAGTGVSGPSAIVQPGGFTGVFVTGQGGSVIVASPTTQLWYQNQIAPTGTVGGLPPPIPQRTPTELKADS